MAHAEEIQRALGGTARQLVEFAELGPVQNFGFLVWWGKLVLILLMLIGRLEIYTILLLFHPGLWRR